MIPNIFSQTRMFFESDLSITDEYIQKTINDLEEVMITTDISYEDKITYIYENRNNKVLLFILSICTISTVNNIAEIQLKQYDHILNAVKGPIH